MSETVFFFYKGTWPGKIDLAPREPFGGTPWDDMWSDVPHSVSMEQCAVPLIVKRMVFDDLWSGLTAQSAPSAESSDDEGDRVGQAASAQGQTDAKDAKDVKGKKTPSARRRRS